MWSLATTGVMLESVKREIAGSRVRAARAVNTELIGMYWRIGGLIFDRQADQGWGTRVIDRLAADLRTSFPGARGFSRRSLDYMRALAGDSTGWPWQPAWEVLFVAACGPPAPVTT
jgi:DUF1016 N-terminal domain